MSSNIWLMSVVGAIIVYDITDMHSFEKVKTWVDELRKFLP